jgi:Uma2 family endonuclease
MIANPKLQLMTPQEYLEWEEQQPLKYEYVNGEVFAMTGGTIPHNDISCKVSMADAKLGISEKGPFHYPDIMVTCDERDRNAIELIQYPCLVVELHQYQ